MTRAVRLTLRALTTVISTVCVLMGVWHPAEMFAVALTRTATYAYDGHHRSAPLTTSAPERGPPGAYDNYSPNNAVDRWLHGALAQDVGTPRSPTPDPETGEQVAKTVEHIFVHDDTVIDLVVDGEVITTTEDHPFWSVTDQRFERADELSPGEKVLGADGRVVTVSGLQLGTAREALAYNLSVEGIHTYHVGDAEILVHNQCVIPSKSNCRKLFTDAHPNMPANYQVHHALPQKYAGIMERAGVNIHDPSLLRGVDPAIHSKITTAWGRWERGLGRTPTAHDITQFSCRIDEMYGSSFVW